MTTLLHFLRSLFSAPYGNEDADGFGPLPVALLCAGWLLCGCTVVSANRTFPKLDWYWSKDAKMQRGYDHSSVATNVSIMPPMPVATVQRKAMVSAPMVVTPKPSQCPPLHWEASNGWGGCVISGPVLELLDWKHTGCPQYPNVCTARAWLTETTDYILPTQKTGNEFARIIPFETE